MRSPVSLSTSRPAVVIILIITLATMIVRAARPEVIVAQPAPGYEYRVLATNKTSTMEKELNEAAEAGFRFQAAMGGETAIGGSEVVVVMVRNADVKAQVAYKLLATSKTSTMEKELREAADAGFEYRGQTVFKSAFGGDEVVCILERDKNAAAARSAYRLVATTKTSTLQKELQDAGAAGYALVGMTVAKTAMGGKELVAIMRRAGDLAPDLPLADLQPMTQSLAGIFGYLIFRVGALQATGMRVLGLALALVGVYGVVSFGASLRTREIGIRVALGAQPRDVLRLILGQGLQLVSVGLAVGLVGSLAMGRVLSRFLPLVDATDWLTFASVSAGLAALAISACYMPARRATRVPFMTALRHE